MRFTAIIANIENENHLILYDHFFFNLISTKQARHANLLHYSFVSHFASFLFTTFSRMRNNFKHVLSVSLQRSGAWVYFLFFELQITCTLFFSGLLIGSRSTQIYFQCDHYIFFSQNIKYDFKPQTSLHKKRKRTR